jgi:folate-binding protein YgfZ
MVTNDVAGLGPGAGCYAAHLNAQGKIVAQMIVLPGEEETTLLVERVAAEKLTTTFDKLIIMEDVQVHNASEEWDVIAVIGPPSAALIESWAGHAPPVNLYGQFTAPQGRIVVSDLGYDIIVSRGSSPTVVNDLIAAGAKEIDRSTWEVLRTEAGLPLYGVDIDETTTLPELGQRGINYDKGCYIGQEVVARIKYIGHVNRRFVGFAVNGSEIPETRAIVMSGNKDVGYVTSAVFSPALGKPIALGFVNRAAAEPNSEVTLVEKEGRSISASVSALPFVPTRSGD